MNVGLVLFRVTSVVLAIQLLLGGLLTFGFISPAAHIVGGFTLLVLAIATMAAWLVAKPSFRPMRILTVVIVLLIIIQIGLGFDTLDTGSRAVAFVHFVVALAIFGAMTGGTGIALRSANVRPAGSPSASSP